MNNTVQKIKGCPESRAYISFNPSPGLGIGMFAGDGPCGETALVENPPEQEGFSEFFILNGNFLADYEGRTLAQCREFFNKNRAEHESSWSAHKDA